MSHKHAALVAYLSPGSSSEIGDPPSLAGSSNLNQVVGPRSNLRRLDSSPIVWTSFTSNPAPPLSDSRTCPSAFPSSSSDPTSFSLSKQVPSPINFQFKACYRLTLIFIATFLLFPSSCRGKLRLSCSLAGVWRRTSEYEYQCAHNRSYESLRQGNGEGCS